VEGGGQYIKNTQIKKNIWVDDPPPAPMMAPPLQSRVLLVVVMSKSARVTRLIIPTVSGNIIILDKL